MFKGKHIFLRPVEPSDATKIMLWENNPENWKVTGTEAPYSLNAILEYINSIHSFRKSGELKLMICKNETNEAIGSVELYDANFKHNRAFVGILIAEKNERGLGYAKESLILLEEYARLVLGFHTLTASVHGDNLASVKLFTSCGYELVGVRKEWYFEHGKRIDEQIFQLCLNQKK